MPVAVRKARKSCQREQDRLNNTVLTARIYTATGKHSQAGALLDTLLESTDKEQYKDIYADALFASAENNKLLKQYATALKQAEQSLEIRRKVHKSTSSKIVDSVNQCNEINKLIKRKNKMKPCKAAYKIVRDGDNEIFKGFGFRHLSDATQYYVHPDNQSYKGTTTLCQPIGEAVMLLTDFVISITEDAGTNGDICYSDTATQIYLDMPVQAEWHANNITSVYRYRAMLDNSSVRVGAYDADDNYIVSNPVSFTETFKIIPVLVLLLAQKILTDNAYKNAFLGFCDFPDAATFVNIHEDFYQSYKTMTIR